MGRYGRETYWRLEGTCDLWWVQWLGGNFKGVAANEREIMPCGFVAVVKWFCFGTLFLYLGWDGGLGFGKRWNDRGA